MPAREADHISQTYRRHPRWRVLGFRADSSSFHETLWPRLGEDGFARLWAFDWCIVLSLLCQGAIEFATVNTKDFIGLGFTRVWNPSKG